MLNDTLDDDTHLCIKCNVTIVGIEEYIRHRKANCTVPGNVNSKPSLPQTSSTVGEDYAEHDHAYGITYDDAKKDEDEHHSPIHNFDYDLGADFFFSSLELQSSSKKPVAMPPPVKEIKRSTRNATRDSTKDDRDVPDEGVWLSKASPTDKLIHAVSAISGPKRVVNDEFKYFNDDSPDEDVDEADDTDPEEYGDAPPKNYTGGKWKPENRPNSSLLRGNWERAWEEDLNPKNADDRLDKSFDSIFDDELKSFSPPPGHTKGKWIPGSKITRLQYDKVDCVFPTVKYWCSSCNRRLASKLVYERHLKSNLHLKRMQEEHDLETIICPTVESHKKLSERRTLKPSVYTRDSFYQSTTEFKSPDKRPKRIRRKYFTKCDLCNTRLPIKLLGKHLISHYHYRRMQKQPDKGHAFILKNIEKIVIQSPFQCNLCKFYANTEYSFLKHWNSQEHASKVDSVQGFFLCNFCKFQTPASQEMTSHLSSSEHQEVIQAINRSVPIVIYKITPLTCSICHQEFRYNIELNKHLTICDKDKKTAADQKSFVCEICQKGFKSRLGLQKHQALDHGKKRFYCSLCKQDFESPVDAKKHRRTTEHRIKSARARGVNNERLNKKCAICKKEFQDILAVKDHIKDAHPDVKYSCPHCGNNFILPQELSRHVRDKSCNFFTNLSSLVTDTSGEMLSGNESVQQQGRQQQQMDTVMKETQKMVAFIENNKIIDGTNENTAGKMFGTTRNNNDDEEEEEEMRDVITTITEATENRTMMKTFVVMEENNAVTSGGCSSNDQQYFAVSESSTSNVNGIYVDETDESIAAVVPSSNGNGGTNEIMTETWKCKLCDFRTASQAEFIYHKILHTVGVGKAQMHKLKLDCPFCKRVYGKSSLRCHLRVHTNERIFQCEKCSWSFTRASNLKDHIRNVHDQEVISNMPAPFICDVCSKKFRSKHLLSQHMHVHRRGINNELLATKLPCKVFNCTYDTCPFIGRSMAELKLHVVSKHSLDPRNTEFMCEYDGCNYLGKSMSLLKRHMESHNPPKRIYECDKCDFQTRHSGHLKRHGKVHGLSEQEYLHCPHCDYKCNIMDNLRKHVIRTTKHKGRFLYECSECNAGTHSAKEFKEHLSHFHGHSDVNLTNFFNKKS